MAATLFDDGYNIDEIKQNLRTLGFHSLHPDIVYLYYGHLYKREWNVEYCFAVAPIRGKTYIFTEAAVPSQLKMADNRIHSPLSIGKGDKYTEVVYDLSKLSNREEYGSKKSYYNAVKAPARYVEKEDLYIELHDSIDEAAMPEFQTLYDKWVQQKKDRGVHLITFPVARYRRCINLVNEMKNLSVITLRRKSDDSLLAFRVVLIDKDLGNAYDIVFVSDLDITQLSNAFNFVGLQLLYHCGVKDFNCGVSTGKLKAYKKQYPNYEKVVHLVGGDNAR